MILSKVSNKLHTINICCGLSKWKQDRELKWIAERQHFTKLWSAVFSLNASTTEQTCCSLSQNQVQAGELAYRFSNKVVELQIGVFDSLRAMLFCESLQCLGVVEEAAIDNYVQNTVNCLADWKFKIAVDRFHLQLVSHFCKFKFDH